MLSHHYRGRWNSMWSSCMNWTWMSKTSGIILFLPNIRIGLLVGSFLVVFSLPNYLLLPYFSSSQTMIFEWCTISFSHANQGNSPKVLAFISLLVPFNVILGKLLKAFFFSYLPTVGISWCLNNLYLGQKKGFQRRSRLSLQCRGF